MGKGITFFSRGPIDPSRGRLTEAVIDPADHDLDPQVEHLNTAKLVADRSEAGPGQTSAFRRIRLE
jgi:hypothetical protein